MSLLAEEGESREVAPAVTAAARAAKVVDLRSVKSLRDPEPAAWTVVGQPVRDAALRRRVQALLADLAVLPDIDPAAGAIDVRDHAAIRRVLDRAHDALAAALGDGDGARAARLAPVLVDVQRLRDDLAEVRAAQLQARYDEVRAALSRLRSVTTVEQLLERAPVELCKCGFDRVIVSRVHDSLWEVERVHVEGDAEWATEIARVANAHPKRIDHLLVEGEMMRRRAPVLVADARNEPRTHGAIGAASLSRSYVAAPIMPEGRIIGFLHADGYMSRRHVDDDDLAVLWMFTEGFGYVFHRTALMERLRCARDQVQALTRSMAASMDSVCGGELSLEQAPAPRPAGEPPAAIGVPTAASLVAPQSRLESLLSRREIEVLSLMAQGKSNGEIATHLVISEGTVKSHVKHILRKLRAANRAEAVFRFMRLTALQGAAKP